MIHRGLTFSEYQALEGVNHSTLKLVSDCPARAEHETHAPRAQTAGMRLGTLAHMAVLEPVRYRRQVVVTPSGIDRRTKEGKARWDAFLAESQGKEILDGAEEAEQILEIATAVMSHPAARELLDGAAADAREVVATWNDAETGRACKARADAWPNPALVDLKTTSGKACPDAVAREAFKYGWHTQAAWYMDGWAAAGHPVERFAFIVVETKAPHLVAVYQLDQAAIELGRAQNREALALLHVCKSTGRWPGYSGDLELISLPRWAFNHNTDEEVSDGE